MARSPLTLAAAATSALPAVGIRGVGSFSAGGSGRCDSAVLTLDDGRTLIVRAPADDATARELASEAIALRALTPGVRELLGLRAPELVGEAGLGDARALLTDLLPGYQIDAAHLPAGPGAAVSVGRALAALHALPASVVRAEGLPVRAPEEVRADTASLVSRADATQRLPRVLAERWRRAVEADELWRFESTVTLGGAAAGSFLFEDTDRGPQVTGLLDWHGLAVGDPAIDLRWLASAADAAEDVLDAYHDASHRAPDARLQSRSRLYAELEFATWLLHGEQIHRQDIIDDAVGLLQALADGVRDDLFGADGTVDVEDALTLIDRMPRTGGDVDTSMQTDAYDPEQLSLFLATEREFGQSAATAPTPTDPDATAPIEVVDGDEQSRTRPHAS